MFILQNGAIRQITEAYFSIVTVLLVQHSLKYERWDDIYNQDIFVLAEPLQQVWFHKEKDGHQTWQTFEETQGKEVEKIKSIKRLQPC